VGAIAGGAWGAVREYRDGSVRTDKDVREELGLRCLGLLPAISIPNIGRQHRYRSLTDTSSKNPREVSHALSRFVDLFPDSKFAETLRSVSVSVAGKGPEGSKVIGILSIAPQEGRSLIAANLATLLGRGEGPTLLIDGDTRNPHLSSIFAPDATIGLLDVLAGACAWNDALRCGPVRRVAMLPIIKRPDLPHPSHLLAGEQLDQVLRDAATHFKYVVVDLPPLSVASEARILARKVDCVLLVVKWGETSKELIREVLAADEGVRLQCAGAILNVVDMGRIRQYQECGHTGAGTLPA
jgi:succinoglycan biosynthesis transport protein ExoP